MTLQYEKRDPVNQQLRQLATLHYVLGGVIALCGSIFLVPVVVGILIVSGNYPIGPAEPKLPREFGYLYLEMGTPAFLAAQSLAVLILMTGRKLQRHTSLTFCMAIAGIECIIIPLGTALGVFALVMLMKPAVKQKFVHA